MKHIILSTFLIGALFANTSSFAQDHHHGHANSEATKPIVEIMRGMSKNLNILTGAIIMEDYSLIASSAHDIANHPGIAQEDLHILFERLGPRKEAFIACDTDVHNLAKDVSKAGEQRDIDRAFEKYSAMLRKTIECHRKYK